MASELLTMTYKIVRAKNHLTGETYRRPVITNRHSMGLKKLVEFAIKGGFMRGQLKELIGSVSGFFEAVKDRALAGYTINLGDMLIITGHLQGTVDESLSLTKENEYHLSVRVKKEMQVPLETFAWVREDDNGNHPKVERITSTQGVAIGEIKKSVGIVVSGQNLVFSAANGDKVIITWTEDGETQSATVTPKASSTLSMDFDWPAALSEVAAGTEVTFTFHLYEDDGKGGKLVLPITKKVKVID